MKILALILLLPTIALSCASPDSEGKQQERSQSGAKPKTKPVKPAPSADVDLKTAKKIYDEAAAGKSEIVILDIRTPQEFKEGHLKGAVNIDYLVPKEEFQAELKKLDPKAKYLMHCQSGGRSSDAAKMMEKLGFTSVYHLKDGFRGWQKAGYEVAKD